MRAGIVPSFRPLLAALAISILVGAAPSHARIIKIVIDEKISPAFCKGTACTSFGDAGPYEQISGRAFGELDPRDPLNSIIQDLALGKDTDGKVRYVTTFVITKPVECEGNNAGVGALTTNPMPHTETVNALTVHFRDWVMRNTPPPASRWPTLRERQLVEANKTALGFPTLPGLRATAAEASSVLK